MRPPADTFAWGAIADFTDQVARRTVSIGINSPPADRWPEAKEQTITAGIAKPERPTEYLDQTAVLGHSARFRPAWWIGRPGVPWVEWMDHQPDADGLGYKTIARADLLKGSRLKEAANCGELLLRCYVWGTGHSGFLVGRRARVYRDTPPMELQPRLSDAASILRSEGPVAAYASLDDWDRNRIKNMRASFFTKYLYAADADESGGCGRALILDRFVAIALNDLHGFGISTTGGWSAETYGRWLDLAHGIATDASVEGSLVRPDAVELSYFRYGQALDKWARAQGAGASA